MHFDGDNTSAIVPISRLEKEDNLTAGQHCNVLWSNKKRYPGILMCSGGLHVYDVCHCNLVTILCEFDMKDYYFIGSMDVCTALQEELEKSEESDEGGNLDDGSKPGFEVQSAISQASKEQDKANSSKRQPKV